MQVGGTVMNHVRYEDIMKGWREHMQNIKFHPIYSFPTTTSVTATTVDAAAADDCGKEFVIPVDSP